MQAKKKVYQKWWFWFCIILMVLVVGFLLFCTNSTSIIKNVNLNKKMIVGKLTYYIDDSWKTTESSSTNVQYKYYYPTEDTMLMIQFSNSGNYGDSTTISNFLDSYITGMDLDSTAIINKTTKSINNINYGMIRCYINNYETIQYIFPNNNEAYIFCFGQENHLNESNIELVEDILKKVHISIEKEGEQQTVQSNNTDTETGNNKEYTKNTNINSADKKETVENKQHTINTTTNKKNQQQNDNSQSTEPTKQKQQTTNTTQPKPNEAVNIQAKYQSILNEYTTKLKSKTPSLITEYKNEASKNTSGLSGLANICNNKVSVLAGISTEGIGKMADIYYKYGNGKYSEYESWADKLQDVYMEEAGKIQDVYMDSAM